MEIFYLVTATLHYTTRNRMQTANFKVIGKVKFISIFDTTIIKFMVLKPEIYHDC
jgi:hypothetical protein